MLFDAVANVQTHWQGECEPKVQFGNTAPKDDCPLHPAHHFCEDYDHEHRQCDYCGQYLIQMVTTCEHGAVMTSYECSNDAHPEVYRRQYGGWK